jgi:hypothetical protein
MESKDLTPDKKAERENLGEIILENLFRVSGYPWQVLVVIMMKLDYKPREIIKVFSEMTLFDFYNEFSSEFIASSFRASDELEKLFEPLKLELNKPLDEVIQARDSRTRKKMNDFLEKTCGTIVLKTFFGNNPNKNISDWNARSIMRLKKELTSQGITI